MKQHFERYGIYYLIGVVFLIGLLVCLAIYRPAVGTEISNQNAAWGDFGAFFWGFGTMCFTLINIIIFYAISQRLYRKQFFDTYRDALERLTHSITDKKATHLNIVNIIGFLGGLYKVTAFNSDVKEEVLHLMAECAAYLKDPQDNRLSELLGKLTAFQVCLIVNEYKGDES